MPPFQANVRTVSAFKTQTQLLLTIGFLKQGMLIALNAEILTSILVAPSTKNAILEPDVQIALVTQITFKPDQSPKIAPCAVTEIGIPVKGKNAIMTIPLTMELTQTDARMTVYVMTPTPQTLTPMKP